MGPKRGARCHFCFTPSPKPLVPGHRGEGYFFIVGTMARKLPPPGTGGVRPNSGRKPSAFLEQCRALAGSPKFLKWAEDVLDGKLVDSKATMAGIVEVPASVSDRISLWEKLAAYGFGKPVQAVELSGEVQGRIVLVRPGTV